MSVSYQTVTVGGVEVFYRESDPGDAGHFALETHTEEIGDLMLNFLNKQVS
jgi:hypothetical protein